MKQANSFWKFFKTNVSKLEGSAGIFPEDQREIIRADIRLEQRIAGMLNPQQSGSTWPDAREGRISCIDNNPVLLF